MFSKKTKFPDRRSGFTLVELLIATLLLPILAFAVYANFSSGLRMWERLNREIPEETLDLFTQKVARDFRSVTQYSPVPFSGSKEGVSFAGHIWARPELGGDRGIGQIRLSYDADHRTVVREEKNVNQIYKETEGWKKVLLADVQFFETSFFCQDPQDKSYQWREDWESGRKDLPIAVRIDFQVGRNGSRESRVFTIPVGGT